MRDGSPILEHPLYLKYNGLTLKEITDTYYKKGILQQDIGGIMATNDNMAVVWYLNYIFTVVRGLRLD